MRSDRPAVQSVQLSVRQVRTKMILVPLVSCVLVWHIEPVTGCKGGGGEPKQVNSKDDETGDNN